MADLGAGLIISGIISGISNLFGASQAADASSHAADVMGQAAANALDFEKQVYANSTKQQAPWVGAGQAAVGKLTELMGLSMPSQPGPSGGPPAPPTLPDLGNKNTYPVTAIDGTTPANTYSPGTIPTGGGFGGPNDTSGGNPWNNVPVGPPSVDPSVQNGFNGFFTGNPFGSFIGGGGDNGGTGDQTYGDGGGDGATHGLPRARGATRPQPLDPSLASVGTGGDASGPFTVVDAHGVVHSFSTQIQAHTFAQQAGLV